MSVRARGREGGDNSTIYTFQHMIFLTQARVLIAQKKIIYKSSIFRAGDSLSLQSINHAVLANNSYYHEKKKLFFC